MGDFRLPDLPIHELRNYPVELSLWVLHAHITPNFFGDWNALDTSKRNKFIPKVILRQCLEEANKELDFHLNAFGAKKPAYLKVYIRWHLRSEGYPVYGFSLHASTRPASLFLRRGTVAGVEL